MRWSFFGFDWVRFEQIRPALKAAHRSRDFTGKRIAAMVEADPSDEVGAALARFGPDAPPELVCNTLAVAACGTGELVLVEGGLPELIHWLRKQPGGTEAAEMIADLASAAPHIEPFFDSDD